MLTKSRHPAEGLFTVFCSSETWRRPNIYTIFIRAKIGDCIIWRNQQAFFFYFYYSKTQKVILEGKVTHKQTK